jgi:hypothetical protein
MSESEAGFRSELQQLLNRYSMENGSNTPDFVLASFLTQCLLSFDIAVKARDTWHGESRTIEKL